MFDDRFVALMQIYMASHAIHQAKDAAFAAAVRKDHADINDRYNATIVSGFSATDRRALDVYETRLLQRLPEQAAMTSASAVWDAHGFLGGLSSKDVKSGTHDDRVMRYCFAAQSVYAVQTSDEDKDQIAMSVLRGRVSPGLREDLLEYVSEIVGGLRACPDYHFRVYWGLLESQHLANIVQPQFVDDLCHDLFRYPAHPDNTTSA